jgi:hypothetical protein
VSRGITTILVLAVLGIVGVATFLATNYGGQTQSLPSLGAQQTNDQTSLTSENGDVKPPISTELVTDLAPLPFAANKECIFNSDCPAGRVCSKQKKCECSIDVGGTKYPNNGCPSENQYCVYNPETYVGMCSDDKVPSKYCKGNEVYSSLSGSGECVSITQKFCVRDFAINGVCGDGVCDEAGVCRTKAVSATALTQCYSEGGLSMDQMCVRDVGRGQVCRPLLGNLNYKVCSCNIDGEINENGCPKGAKYCVINFKTMVGICSDNEDAQPSCDQADMFVSGTCMPRNYETCSDGVANPDRSEATGNPCVSGNCISGICEVSEVALANDYCQGKEVCVPVSALKPQIGGIVKPQCVNPEGESGFANTPCKTDASCAIVGQVCSIESTCVCDSSKTSNNGCPESAPYCVSITTGSDVRNDNANRLPFCSSKSRSDVLSSATSCIENDDYCIGGKVCNAEGKCVAQYCWSTGICNDKTSCKNTDPVFSDKTVRLIVKNSGLYYWDSKNKVEQEVKSISNIDDKSNFQIIPVNLAVSSIIPVSGFLLSIENQASSPNSLLKPILTGVSLYRLNVQTSEFEKVQIDNPFSEIAHNEVRYFFVTYPASGINSVIAVENSLDSRLPTGSITTGLSFKGVNIMVVPNVVDTKKYTFGAALAYASADNSKKLLAFEDDTSEKYTPESGGTYGLYVFNNILYQDSTKVNVKLDTDETSIDSPKRFAFMDLEAQTDFSLLESYSVNFKLCDTTACSNVLKSGTPSSFAIAATDDEISSDINAALSELKNLKNALKIESDSKNVLTNVKMSNLLMLMGLGSGDTLPDMYITTRGGKEVKVHKLVYMVNNENNIELLQTDATSEVLAGK